jgi:hypothetical protein
MKTYQARYNPIINKGVYGISLVESPAMEGTFIALKEQEKPIELKTVSEEQRILLGLVLEPNKLIYRFDEQTKEEFNITFDEQTIKDLAYGFFKSNSHGNSTIEHDNNPIKGVTFTESWIVENPTNDKSNNFGFSYPKGSWVAVMKVDSDEVWHNYVKTGKVLGFSIDAMLSLEEVNLKSNITMSKEILEEQQKASGLLEKILLAFTPKQEEVKVNLGSIKIADGSITIEFEGDALTAELACWVVAEDGTKVPVPVGEYELEDASILVVSQEGIVGEVKVAEAAPAEPAAPEESAPQAMTDEVAKDANMVQEIESAIKSIMIKYSEQEAQITELKVQVLELGKQPASKPINSRPNVNVDFSKLTSKERIFNTINKNK